MYDTALNILNDAAIELGLYSAALVDPFASTDANIIQLRQYLKGFGQDLAREHAWSQLTKLHSFNTAAGIDSYALPADFGRIVDQTGWNDTSRQQLLGPASSQQWRSLKVWSSSGVAWSWFRVVGDRLFLHPTPTAVETVTYEYQSAWWLSRPWLPQNQYEVGDRRTNAGHVYECDIAGTAAPAGGPSGTTADIVDGTARWDYVSALAMTAETPTAFEDTLWFDRRLLIAGLKLFFLRAKGFDSSAAQDDYDRALARALGADGPAPILNLNYASPAGRMLDSRNIPETGYGS